MIMLNDWQSAQYPVMQTTWTCQILVFWTKKNKAIIYMINVSHNWMWQDKKH